LRALGERLSGGEIVNGRTLRGEAARRETQRFIVHAGGGEGEVGHHGHAAGRGFEHGDFLGLHARVVVEIVPDKERGVFGSIPFKSMPSGQHGLNSSALSRSQSLARPSEATGNAMLSCMRQRRGDGVTAGGLLLKQFVKYWRPWK